MSELNSSGGASSLTRKGSKHSDTSSQHSSDSTSPHMRKHKLKFIKNIKPEAFKRPSSFMMSDGSVPKNAGGSVAVDALDCSLVGYRKLDDIPSAPTVELGTLSPGGSHSILLPDAATKNALYNAVSMPTLLAKGHFNMTSSGSMPDLTTESLLDKSSVDLSHMVQAGLSGGGSDSALSKENTSANARATETSLDQTTTTDAKVVPEQNDPVGPNSSISPSDSDSSSHMQNVQNGYITSESEGKASPPSEDVADCPTATGSSVDYNLIAESLSKALGEPEEQTSTEDSVSKKEEESMSQKTDEAKSDSNVQNQKDSQLRENTQSNSDDSKTAAAVGGLSKMDSQGSSSSKGADTSVTSGLGESFSTEPSQEDVEADTLSMDSKPKSDESDDFSLSGKISNASRSVLFFRPHQADSRGDLMESCTVRHRFRCVTSPQPAPLQHGLSWGGQVVCGEGVARGSC